METKGKVYDSANDVLAFTSAEQSFKVGKICGRFWVERFASWLEQTHLLPIANEDNGIWTKWLQEESQYTPAQRFFFALVGDGSWDIDDAKAFWQLFCEWALVDSVCLRGFAFGAAEAACDLRGSCRQRKRPASDATDTKLEIQIFYHGRRLGLGAKLSDGLWEVHPEPLDSSSWAYFDSADEAVERLVEVYGVTEEEEDNSKYHYNYKPDETPPTP